MNDIKLIISKILLIIFFLITSNNSYSIDEFDINLLTEKIIRLEEEISDLQKNLYSSDNQSSVKGDKKSDKKQVSSKYQIRINQLENNLAKMNGRFEEIFFRIDQLEEKINRINSDVDLRLSNKDEVSTGGLPIGERDRTGEKDTIAYPKNTSNVDSSGGDTEILGTIKTKSKDDEAIEIAKNFQSADSLFDHGKNSLKNLDYFNAEQAFKGFVKKFPDNENIPDAYYWLGESLFVREMYPDAILAYGEVIKKHKKHQRASGSLLKIGLSFSYLDKKKESCDALQKIVKQYPDSEQDILKKTKFLINENKC
tara:strand:+ start:13878 stop:14810 length:933 start_codon:yes stop_codon:yes gene_type:complete